MKMAVMFLSHVMDINVSNDSNRAGDPGPMMGIDKARPHHLIGVAWAKEQSR